ncbi:MAG: hypothetical protein HZB59_05880 [Ignavibacteriales bacterium]|nr:hypothetical protein [Ignavibacteriales bacterium]
MEQGDENTSVEFNQPAPALHLTSIKMKQKFTKLNQTSCNVEHTVALKKFIYYSSQQYVIFMRDVNRHLPKGNRYGPTTSS